MPLDLPHFYIYVVNLMHQLGANRHVQHRRGVAFLIKSEQVPTASTSHCEGRILPRTSFLLIR